MTLEQRIRREIEATGPMPFEVFMELALYDPDGGFFTTGKLRSERGGDFLTSPEVSALFGETLARFVEQERERIGQPFEVVEVAAGSGSLIGPLMGAIEVDVSAVEVSPAAREALGAILDPDRVRSDLPDRIRGVVIVNELIDNLPMALAQRVESGWRERWVGMDGDGLAMVDAPARPEVLAWLAAFAGDVPEGGWVEVQLAAAAWLRDVLRRLDAGSVIALRLRGHRREPDTPTSGRDASDLSGAPSRPPSLSMSPGRPISLPTSTSPLWSQSPRRQGWRSNCIARTTSSASSGWGTISSSSVTPSWRQRDRETRWSGSSLRTLKTEAETLLHPRGLGDFRVLVARK